MVEFNILVSHYFLHYNLGGNLLMYRLSNATSSKMNTSQLNIYE